MTGASALVKIYDKITNAFVYTVTVNGKRKTMNREQLTSLVRNKSAKIRESAYKSLLSKYNDNKGVTGEIYQNIVLNLRDEGIGMRGFSSPITIRNISNNIGDETIKTLLHVCKKNSKIFQKYFRKKAKLLGMKKLRRYDLYAPAAAKIKEKNLKIKCCYVTDQKVEYQDELVEIIDEGKIIQKLWERIKKPAAGKKSSIKLERMLTHENTILGILKLRELTEFVNKNKDYVFESNIRQWMQFKTTVNKGLRDTLQTNPGKFFFYNNGITIVVSDFTDLGENMIELFAPQIVNGAQTSNSILDHSKRTKNMEGSMTVTIIKADDEQEQNNITKYRNSQNSVRGKDLVSLMDFHKSIKSQLKNCGYFYEIQAGSFDTKSKSKQLEYSGDTAYNNYLPDNHKKVIVAKDAIQSLVAGIEQRPTESYSSPSQFLPRGSKYDQIFNDNLKDDYRIILYPYLVKEFAKKSLKYGKKGGHKTKRYATLFFVAVYFRILHKKILESKGDFKSDIRKLEPIFHSFKLNNRILKITDVIVTKFLDDTVVDDEIELANTKHNFFSQHVWNDSMLRVIDKKIKQEEEEITLLKKIANNLF